MKRIISLFLLLIFAIQSIFSDLALAQALPLPASNIVQLTAPFAPTVVRGIIQHPDNPFQFDFIVESGDDYLKDDAFQKESMKLIKYFLTSLTIPENDMWVNLNPKEKDRIIPQEFGTTDMGRDMLAQDYMLKQLTASLMNPDDKLGKEFWRKVYDQAQAKFGTTDIPMDTLSKVWIVPDKAQVYVKGESVYVVESHLKVMLEGDYLDKKIENGEEKMEKDQATNPSSDFYLLSSILKEIILPALEHEINTGKNFALLRQIQNSAILAAWYKKNLKESLLAKIYIDQKKTDDIAIKDKDAAQEIYNQYLQAFQKGAHELIKEEYDPNVQEVVTRKYVTGGVLAKYGDVLHADDGQMAERQLAQNNKEMTTVTWGLDSAMIAAGNHVINPNTDELSYQGENSEREPKLKISNRIIAMRHGESGWNQKTQELAKISDQKVMEFYSNVTVDEIAVLNLLSKKGKRQAARGAQRLFRKLRNEFGEDLAKWRELVVVASAMKRTQQTAQAFINLVKKETAKFSSNSTGEAVVLNMTIDKRGNEISHGETHGMTEKEKMDYEEFLKLYYQSKDVRVKTNVGESFQDVINRNERMLIDLNQKYPNRTILLFGHQRQLVAVKTLFGHRDLLDEHDVVDFRKFHVPNAEPFLMYSPNQIKYGYDVVKKQFEENGSMFSAWEKKKESWGKRPEIQILKGGQHTIGSNEDETLTLVDENGNRITETETKSNVHAQGLWHLTAHNYVFDQQGRLLLQVRSKDKKQSPGKLQVSVSGHVDANESLERAVEREGIEEIGINLSGDRVKKIGQYKRTQSLSEGANNEFVHVYRSMVTDDELAQIQQKFNLNESDELWLIPPELFKEMVADIPQAFSNTLNSLFNENISLWEEIVESRGSTMADSKIDSTKPNAAMIATTLQARIDFIKNLEQPLAQLATLRENWEKLGSVFEPQKLQPILEALPKQIDETTVTRLGSFGAEWNRIRQELESFSTMRARKAVLLLTQLERLIEQTLHPERFEVVSGEIKFTGKLDVPVTFRLKQDTSAVELLINGDLLKTWAYHEFVHFIIALYDSERGVVTPSLVQNFLDEQFLTKQKIDKDSYLGKLRLKVRNRYDEAKFQEATLEESINSWLGSYLQVVRADIEREISPNPNKLMSSQQLSVLHGDLNTAAGKRLLSAPQFNNTIKIFGWTKEQFQEAARLAFDIENEVMLGDGSVEKTVTVPWGDEDSAMTADFTKGGIDLNANESIIEEQGDKAQFPMLQTSGEFKNISINRFVPVIFRISPPTTLPYLLGLTSNNRQEVNNLTSLN